ncbi:hypothetical protein JOB18_015904 [Solea senegalensis]|uniref:MANSC domain-containing protein n=1 Tax=Solea senegalensis TaxID=28829 RepID=A0AAV6PK62_SOLSE|nr:kunitz-type protease inhibitor 1-like [Solea senegalensis]KAG7468732.1 hypothetical protein JOB18_015904 [Solea senegalensis]
MTPSSSSSSNYLPLPRRFLFLVLVLLPLLRRDGAAEDAVCGDTFRSTQNDFVLDAEDAAMEGAALLATAHVQSPDDCQRACCGNPSCDLALLQPRAAAAVAAASAAENRTCALFSCVHRNRFVCRFVNQAGYHSYIRESVFRKHLAGPTGTGEPIANAGRDVIVQPGKTVTLNGIESLALGDAHISDYHWSVLSGQSGINMEKTDLPDQVSVSDLRPGHYVFQLTVTDSNNQSDDAKVSVLVLGPELSSCEYTHTHTHTLVIHDLRGHCID